ncbi:MAG: HAD-IC family P-type ATPase [Bacillota bacterium]|nr:HAD-IC family P-type ATPase [Bacillota bacterium]
MYHQKDINELFQGFNSGPEGISRVEALNLLEEHGPNTIESEIEFSILQAVFRQFTDPLIYILLVAAVFTAVIRHFIDMWVILAVVLINAIIGFTQEIKAEQAIRSLTELSAPRAHVIREGNVMEIDSAHVVPSDVVTLTSGARIPADLRLFEVNRLEINESALTGESLGSSKNTDPIMEKHPAMGDLRNMAFMGTLVLSGRGKGLVVATGQATELGKISEQVRRVKPSPTPLQVQLENFSRWLGYIIISISALAVLLGLAFGRPLAEMLLTGIALAVGAIPEGLPVVVTITFSIGVKRMAGKNAIIRRLPAVETLGSTTVIASDKTGTMTKNEMTVQLISCAGVTYRVSGIGFEPEGEITDENGEPPNPKNRESLELCLRAGLLSNESRLVFEEEQGYYPEGDPTEVALIVAAMKGGFDPETQSILYPTLDEIPFESDLMYMATLHKDSHGDGNLIYIKGAPEKVIGMCSSILTEDGEEVLNDRESIIEKSLSMSGDGLRILAFAYRREQVDVTAINPEMLQDGLTLIGFQGMMDPPRDEVFEAIAQAKRSGVRVMMVTGDHQTTAAAIARRIKMIEEDDLHAITGRELDEMSDEELYDKVGYVNIFARVAPLHKLRIVQQLMKRGEVVAVTGDGVNDSPALKAAHIGIAMGKGGTDAAKETSDMIVTDDNFASILAALKEGRVVYDNIRKVILFLLSTGLAQIILILVSLLFGIPLPLLPAQILWLNLVTNGLQDVALAFEPGGDGLLDKPPRQRDEAVISRLMMERLVLIGIVIALGTLFTFIFSINRGYNIDHARTVALTTIVLFQLFNVFNVRSEKESIFRTRILSNPFLFYSVVASVIAQILIIYVPGFQFVFRTSALPLQDWLLIIVVAVTILAVVEGEKALRRSMVAKKEETL